MKKIIFILILLCCNAFSYNMGSDDIKFLDCKTADRTALFNEDVVDVKYCGFTTTCYEKYNDGCRHLAIVTFEVTTDYDYAFMILPIIPPDIVDSATLAETDSIAIRGAYTEYHISGSIERKCIEWFTPHWGKHTIELEDDATTINVPDSKYCMSNFLPNDTLNNKQVKQRYTKHRLYNYINELNFTQFLHKK